MNFICIWKRGTQTTITKCERRPLWRIVFAAVKMLKGSLFTFTSNGACVLCPASTLSPNSLVLSSFIVPWMFFENGACNKSRIDFIVPFLFSIWTTNSSQIVSTTSVINYLAFVKSSIVFSFMKSPLFSLDVTHLNLRQNWLCIPQRKCFLWIGE